MCVALANTDSATRARTIANTEMNSFWKRNQDRRRPVAPWIIFKPQLPMLLSLQHRVTGVTMGLATYMAAIAIFAVPYDFPQLIEMLKGLELHPVITFSMRFILAYPLVYHYFNGARHLAWDAGKGFRLPELYKSGYFVQFLSLGISIAICSIPFFT